MKEIIKYYSGLKRQEKEIGLYDLLDDIKIYITGLIGSSNEVDYNGLLDFKRKVLEIEPIKYFSDLNQPIDILNEDQKKLVNLYREELSLSAIYGTPINETKEEKDLLLLGENLNNIVQKVDDILKIIKNQY